MMPVQAMTQQVFTFYFMYWVLHLNMKKLLKEILLCRLPDMLAGCMLADFHQLLMNR